jgi:hypothetical protein
MGETAQKDIVNDPTSQKQDTPANKQNPTYTTNTTMPSDDHSTQVPKKKRSREQLDVSSSNDSEAVAELAPKPAQTEPSEEKSADAKEPEKKRHRDSSQEHETKTDKVGSRCSSHLTFQPLTIYSS